MFMKHKLCVYVPTRILDQLTEISLNSPEFTVSDLIRDGALTEVERLEKENGEPFPARGKMKVGRPLWGNRAEALTPFTILMEKEEMERLKNTVFWTRQRISPFISAAAEKRAMRIRKRKK